MKKQIFLLFSALVIISNANAKNIDPYYLNSDTIDMDNIEKKEEKPIDKRSLNEKLRKKLHLPPAKTLYYHNIDKSNIPITMDDYLEMSKEKLRNDFDIPEPEFEKDKDFISIDPKFRTVSYNNPPGQRNIDLSKIINNRTVSSPAILSPDKTKMIYTKSFYYPQTAQTASAVYFIPIKNSFNDAFDILYKTNVVQGEVTPIFTAGMNLLQKYKFTTLFPLDFSKDSNKIAFKEKIGSNYEGTWLTNIVVYDFKTKKTKKLNSIRDAIITYWRNYKQIELKDYMWDIYPVGWDKNNPDKLIAYAFAYTNDKPMFLGTWSVKSDGRFPKLVSISSTDAEIDLNGYGLMEVKFQH